MSIERLETSCICANGKRIKYWEYGDKNASSETKHLVNVAIELHDKRMMAHKCRVQREHLFYAHRKHFVDNFGSKQCKNQHCMPNKRKLFLLFNVIYVYLGGIEFAAKYV